MSVAESGKRKHLVLALRDYDMEAMSIAGMRALEEKAFASGTTVLGLMERAGAGCARLIESRWGAGNRILIFCGPGNNGGDGLVCARYLARNNDVTVIMPIGPKTEDAQTNRKRAEDAGVWMGSMGSVDELGPDIVVDALLGIGAEGGLRGPIKKACKAINSIDALKVSIDVPTGMDADSGKCDKDAVRPDATICIQAPKTGEIDAKEKTGELWLVDIGLIRASA